MYNSRLSLKILYEILLLLPPLENIFGVDFLLEFIRLKCGCATEHDSFVSIVDWMESHLGCNIADTSEEVVQKILFVSHPKILAMLVDRGLPMISDAALAVLRNFERKIRRDDQKSETDFLDDSLEKLQVLKQHGVYFPKSLLSDAFADLALDDKLPRLFRHSEQISRIFDFLIYDCGCDVDMNVFLRSLRWED